jgi:uncharacterized protein YjiS (DUF1127 family)
MHSTSRPDPQKYPSFTSNPSEYPMLNSQSAVTAVRRYSTPGHFPRVAPRDRREIAPQQLMPIAAISEAEESPLPAGRPMGQAGAIWRSVLWFFLEGFALYGASLHWVATTAVTAIASEVGARQRQKLAGRERQKFISLVSPSAGAGITVLEREDAIDRTAPGTRMVSARDGFASAGHAVDRHRFVHPGWLATVWRTIAGHWARRSRERGVKKAVAALARYDDRTLQDLGIYHRSQIEQIVRDGRDC